MHNFRHVAADLTNPCRPADANRCLQALYCTGVLSYCPLTVEVHSTITVSSDAGTPAEQDACCDRSSRDVVGDGAVVVTGRVRCPEHPTVGPYHMSVKSPARHSSIALVAD